MALTVSFESCSTRIKHQNKFLRPAQLTHHLQWGLIVHVDPDSRLGPSNRTKLFHNQVLKLYEVMYAFTTMCHFLLLLQS